MADKNIIQQYFDGINNRDYPLIKLLLAEDFTFHLSPEQSFTGYENTIIAQLKPYVEKDDLKYKLTNVEIDGDTAIVKTTKIVPDSDEEEHYTEKLRFENGKIAEQWVLDRD